MKPFGWPSQMASRQGRKERDEEQEHETEFQRPQPWCMATEQEHGGHEEGYVVGEEVDIEANLSGVARSKAPRTAQMLTAAH